MKAFQFESRPFWESSPEGTRELWKLVIVLNFILGFFISFILCAESGVAVLFCLLVVLVLGGRMLWIRARGKSYPILGQWEKLGYLLLPFYGIPAFVIWVGILQDVKERFLG